MKECLLMRGRAGLSSPCHFPRISTDTAHSRTWCISVERVNDLKIPRAGPTSFLLRNCPSTAKEHRHTQTSLIISGSGSDELKCTQKANIWMTLGNNELPKTQTLTQQGFGPHKSGRHSNQYAYEMFFDHNEIIQNLKIYNKCWQGCEEIHCCWYSKMVLFFLESTLTLSV